MLCVAVGAGPSAVLVVGGNIHVLIMSVATYDWADEQYIRMGLDPAGAKFIGVKNPMNFRLGERTPLRCDYTFIVPIVPASFCCGSRQQQGSLRDDADIHATSSQC